MKMDTSLEKLDVSFDDVVINKVLSHVIINFLSTRPMSILMDPLFVVDEIEWKKNPNAFVSTTLLFGKQPSRPKTCGKT